MKTLREFLSEHECSNEYVKIDNGFLAPKAMHISEWYGYFDDDDLDIWNVSYIDDSEQDECDIYIYIE